LARIIETFGVIASTTLSDPKIGVIVLSSASAMLLIFSFISLRTGKTLRGKVSPGNSPYWERDEDSAQFWITVSCLITAGLISGGAAVWLLFVRGR
jgi:hypothetical protein